MSSPLKQPVIREPLPSTTELAVTSSGLLSLGPLSGVALFKCDAWICCVCLFRGSPIFPKQPNTIAHLSTRSGTIAHAKQKYTCACMRVCVSLCLSVLVPCDLFCVSGSDVCILVLHAEISKIHMLGPVRQNPYYVFSIWCS